MIGHIIVAPKIRMDGAIPPVYVNTGKFNFAHINTEYLCRQLVV